MPLKSFSLPADFLLGVSSAAYQIEGAWNADGKGESIWDRWTHEGRSKVTGDVVVDHYHRIDEDVALLGELGVNAYRFSIAWTRLLPSGRGRPNPSGIAFYRGLLKRLRQSAIEPCVTLYHWDLPQALQEEGGWINRRTAEAFEEYARLCFSEFGDLVTNWITLNEPWVSAFLGHSLGTMAPGLQGPANALQASHSLLLAHGGAVRAFRASGSPGRIGITLDLLLGLPATPDPRDVETARLMNDSHLAWFADPVFKGAYPPHVVALYERKGIRLPLIEPDDMVLISQPVDFLGLNYYNTDLWRHAEGHYAPYDAAVVPHPEAAYKKPTWHPEGLEMLLQRLHADYSEVDLIVTENGLKSEDFVNHRGEVCDDERLEYVYWHLAACRRALDFGVPLKGYFAWSFLDDYEWDDFGRMGLVWADYEPPHRRLLKNSGRWFASCIRENRFQLPDPAGTIPNAPASRSRLPVPSDLTKCTPSSHPTPRFGNC